MKTRTANIIGWLALLAGLMLWANLASRDCEKAAECQEYLKAYGR